MSEEIRISIEGDNDLGKAFQSAAGDLAKFSKVVQAVTSGVDKLDQQMDNLASSATNAKETADSLNHLSESAKTLNRVFGGNDSQGLLNFVDFLVALSDAAGSSPILKSAKNLDRLGEVMSKISTAFASLDVSGDKARVANALGNMMKSLGTVERLKTGKLLINVQQLDGVFTELSTAATKLDKLGTDKRVNSIKAVESLAKSVTLLANLDLPKLNALSDKSAVDGLTALDRITSSMNAAMKNISVDQGGIEQKIGAVKTFVSSLSQLSRIDVAALTQKTTGQDIADAAGRIMSTINNLGTDEKGNKTALTDNAVKAVNGVKNLVTAMSGLSHLDLSGITDDKLKGIGTHMDALMGQINTLGGQQTDRGDKAVSSIASIVRAVGQLNNLDTSNISVGKRGGTLDGLITTASAVQRTVNFLGNNSTESGSKAVSSISSIVRAASQLNKLDTANVGVGKRGGTLDGLITTASGVQKLINYLGSTTTEESSKAVSNISSLIRAVSQLNKLDTSNIAAAKSVQLKDAALAVMETIHTLGGKVTDEGSRAVSNVSNLVRAIGSLNRLDISKIGNLSGTGTLNALSTYADQVMSIVNKLGKNTNADSAQAVASVSNLVRAISTLSKLDLTGLSSKANSAEIEQSIGKLGGIAQKLAGLVNVDATKSINAFTGLIRALDSLAKIDTAKLTSNLSPAVGAMSKLFAAMQGMTTNVGKGTAEAARAISSLMSSVAKLAAVDTAKLKEVMAFLGQTLLKPGGAAANPIAQLFGMASKTSFNSTSDAILKLGKSIEGATKGMMALDKLTNSIQRLSKLDATGIKNIATNLKSVVGILNQELPGLVVPKAMEALGNVLGAFPGLSTNRSSTGGSGGGGGGGGGFLSSILGGGGGGGGFIGGLKGAAGGLFNFGKTVLPPLFKGVGNVVSAPFKAVGSFFQAQFTSLTSLADEMVRPLSGISTELKKYAVYKGIYEVENLVRTVFTGSVDTLREFEMFDIGLQGMYAAEYAKDQATITRTYLGTKGLNDEDQYKLDKAKIDYAQMAKDIQFYQQELTIATNAGKESQVELDRRRLKIQELRLEMTKTAREIKELEEISAEPNYAVVRTDEKTVADVLNTPEVTGAVGRLRNWVEDLAIWSQYDFEGIGNALRTAISYGFPLITGEAQDVVRIVTDYASRKGFGADQIERITLALGQIKSSKNLRGTEVRQLSEVGINIYEIIADAMGKSVEDVTAMQAAGEIGSADALSAIFGAMIEQSEGAAREMSLTFGGLINSIQDTLKFGTERLLGPMREVIKPLMLTFVDAYMGDGVDDLSPLKKLLTDAGERLASWVQGGLDTGFDSLFGEGGLQRFVDWALQEPGSTIGGWTAKLIEFVNVVRQVGSEWWAAIKPVVDFGVYVKDSIQNALGRIINAKDVVNSIFVLLSLGITRMIGGSVLGFLKMLIPLATLGTAMASLRMAWESNTWGIQEFGKALKDQITLKALPDFNQAIMDHGIGALTEFQELFSGKQTEFGHFRAFLGDIGAIVGDVFAIIKQEWDSNWPQTQAWLQEKWSNMWLGDPSLPEEEQGGLRKFIAGLLNSAYEGDPEVEEDGIGGWVNGFITRMINDITLRVPEVIQTLNLALVDGIAAIQKLEGSGKDGSIGGALVNLLATIVVSLIPTVVTLGAILANALVSGIMFAFNSIDWMQLLKNNVTDPAMASLGWNIMKIFGAGNLTHLADIHGKNSTTAWLKDIGWNARMLEDKQGYRDEYTQYMIDKHGASKLLESYNTWEPADQSKVNVNAIYQAIQQGRNTPVDELSGKSVLSMIPYAPWLSALTPFAKPQLMYDTIGGDEIWQGIGDTVMPSAQVLGTSVGLTGNPLMYPNPSGGGGGGSFGSYPIIPQSTGQGYNYYPGYTVPPQWLGTPMPPTILPDATSTPSAPIDYNAWAEELIKSLENAQARNAPINVNVSVETVPEDTTEQRVERASETGVRRALRSRGINAY